MTSEIEVLKTNEFLRRRKLRLQQVREQSKDIAKKIRQRAKVEKLRQVVELDAKKQKEYLHQQGQLVRKLEDLYSKGIDNVGASHKSASESGEQDGVQKLDISKLRGKEAAAELRRKKQDKLDKQKKLLDRKLQAREAANEISREKSTAHTNKLINKTSGATQDKVIVVEDELLINNEKCAENAQDKEKPITNDMATQWDLNEPEWEPNIPALSLPKDDSAKENVESRSGKSKRLDLFALSDEMPSSLRGAVTNEERVPIKPSMTMVSEYLQNRALRLREPSIPGPKKPSEDLLSIKETILQTRTSRPEVKNNTEKSLKSTAIDSGVAKKNSVTVYNHSTRDTRDIIHGGEQLVVRDQPNDDDAYSQARRETIVDNTQHQEHQKKMQEMRHKVAMTKQNVEKEYKDTINFLNSLPKDKGRPMRKAFMDEHRQKNQNDNREQKLQQEYKKIEKECRKHSCTKSRGKSKSPVKITDDDFNNRDFQYSWMPVPESDGNLAIHTIPTTVKKGKSGNTVKFSKVDSYHEYRSRHRHTPPTKDISDRQAKRVEAVIIDKNSSDATDYSSNASESSSENIKLVSKDARPETERELSDAERIIIYKILDSKTDKKCKKKEKLMKTILKSLNSIDNNKKVTLDNAEFSKNQHETTARDIENTKFKHLNEGIYKTVSKKGDNITSMSTHILNNQDIDKEATEPNQKFCHCQDQQHDTSINLHSKNGNTSRLSNSCGTCKCDCAGSSKTCNNNSPMPQQSAASVATSINSFKTATNDKTSSALPDGGYVKLIDDGGQEAGNFYIGASGFLKNDAYEVVIQLRKKDCANDKNEEKNAVVDQTSSKEVPISASQTSQKDSVKETIPIMAQESRHSDANEMNDINQGNHPEIVEDKENTEKYIQESEKHSDDMTKNYNAQNGNNQPKLFVDKGVHTSFQMSYAIPSHVPKVDSTSRPATSAYTQTSLSSPNQRPVFFHMSSSTSTAYMSPPELVLPQFLRQDYHIMTDEEKYDTMHILNSRGYISEQEYSEDYHGCRCKKCSHTKKITNKNKLQDCCRKHTKYGKKLNTPPNTVRSQSSVDVCSHKAAKTKHGVSVSSLTCHLHKHKQNSDKTNSQNVGVHKSRSTASSNKKNKTYPETRKNTTRSDLNPVLKNYINKLLALNKESLKAIEVADQDCSAVTTPGSSIINVTNNINKNKPIESKISLKQIKNLLKQQIIRKNTGSKHNYTSDKNYYIQKKNHRRNISVPWITRKRPVHKVKTLNVSKKLQKTKIHIPQTGASIKIASPCSSIKEDILLGSLTGSKTNCRSDISNTSKQIHNLCPSNVSTTPDMTTKINPMSHDSSNNRDFNEYSKNKNDHKLEIPLRGEINSLSCYRSSATSSSDTDNLISQKFTQNLDIPSTTSTQTNQNMQAEINLIKLAENKLQNMEKIADLTEKCTKRLSNLAKVLEEVRKNKSLVYSQISTSDSTSDSDQKSDKHVSHNFPPTQILEPVLDVGKSSKTPSPIAVSPSEQLRERNITTDSTDFVPFFKDIPKPTPFKITEPTNFQNTESLNRINSQNMFKNLENITTASRGRPPPALSRITLKNGQDNVIPHELSTVLEVDSLLSVRLTRENKSDSSNDSNKTVNGTVKHDTSKNYKQSQERKDHKKDPDLVRSNVNVPIQQKNISGSESSDDNKLQVIDINQFNDIMLKPFITFQEHAKKCNLAFDEASNLEDIANDVVTDDISSLHSDGSLPDVIAELLKRNIISEPFKFDSVSNVNSTTVSSESALSVLALSKVRKDKKKQSVVFQNKENISETSDSLSLSSNPDLEIAFKKLGMGWASSTLKKTKERLALSSSTNTSSSSLSQFKLKSFNNKDIPVLVTDSVSSILNVTRKPTDNRRNVKLNSKNAEQQTSLSNSMTVKEFLTNELAKKITFTNKSHRDETGEEFVSLLETKMPEDMKDSEHLVHADNSTESVHSINNRARTSTPVQIFKSMTYHSSSSSNISNGLFSNADDLSSVKVTSNSNKNHSTSDKDDLTVPNFSLRKKKSLSDCSKSD